MGHYKYPIDAKKIGSENKGSQDVIGNTCTGISKNFRIASLHANYCKWANSRVHASDDRKPFLCRASQSRVIEVLNE
jgi:hypothetical protein